MAVRARRDLKRNLQYQVQGIEEILKQLRDTATVSKIEDVFPRMQDQQMQHERLKNLVQNKTRDRDVLLRKSKHAEEMFISYSHSMVESTFWYKAEKKRMLEECETEKAREKCANDLLQIRGEQYERVRTSLQQLAELVRVVKPDGPGGVSIFMFLRAKVTELTRYISFYGNI